MTIRASPASSIISAGEVATASTRDPRQKLLAIFFMGVVSLLHVDVIGTLFVVQPVFVILAFRSLSDDKIRAEMNKPAVRIFHWLSLLWLAGAIVADLVRQSAFQDWTRGWAAIIFTIATLQGLGALLRFRRSRILAYGFGLVVAFAVSFAVQPNDYARSLPWKFGFALPLLLLIGLSTATHANPRWTGPALFWFYGVISLFLGGRSFGGIAFMVGATSVWSSARQKRGSVATLKPSKVLVVLVTMVAAIACIANGYAYLAVHGYLGDKALVKYEQQESAGANIVLAGRPEVVYGISAVINSPILGHGSFATRSYETDATAAALYARLHLAADWNANRPVTDEIPSHSHLVGAWVRAGILGAPIWLWLFGYFSWTLIGSVTSRSSFGALPTVLCMLEVWDIPFSPYGAERIILVPFAFLIAVTARVQSD